MALLLPQARTILKYALFYHGTGHLQKILNIATDRKAAFPNEMAVMKILYLRTRDVIKKWTMPYPNWGVIRGMLDLLWGHGWDS